VVIDGETQGVSPKVQLPAIALGLVGVVLFGLSLVIDGLDSTREVAIGLIVASPIGAIVGFRAGTGTVVGS
jgi:hypothetical protein